MTFPTFLGPLLPLPPAAKAIGPQGLPLGGAGPGGPNALPFAMQVQQQSNWCWAATTSSVSGYFDASSPWNQCNVASTCLMSSCCTVPDPCNCPYTLDDPLRRTGNLQGSACPRSDTFDGLQSEINQGRPVCCHIDWGNNTGHFVAISGYDRSEGDVFIEDSLYGPATIPFPDFVSSYRGSGRWDYTYYTQP